MTKNPESNNDLALAYDPNCDQGTDFILRHNSCWITVKDKSIYILNTGSSVVVQIFRIGEEADDPALDIACAEFDPDHWDEDKQFPVGDWQYEVRNGDTRRGYWEWVAAKREEVGHEQPS